MSRQTSLVERQRPRDGADTCLAGLYGSTEIPSCCVAITSIPRRVPRLLQGRRSARWPSPRRPYKSYTVRVEVESLRDQCYGLRAAGSGQEGYGQRTTACMSCMSVYEWISSPLLRLQDATCVPQRIAAAMMISKRPNEERGWSTVAGTSILAEVADLHCADKGQYSYSYKVCTSTRTVSPSVVAADFSSRCRFADKYSI